ncbi:MAG: oxidoreductase-like domain-containing protein, partial [Pseudomonadota bacterium]
MSTMRQNTAIPDRPAVADTDADADPMPRPPASPEPDACCHSGCTYCVDDLYQDELDNYRSEIEKKHPGEISNEREALLLLPRRGQPLVREWTFV